MEIDSLVIVISSLSVNLNQQNLTYDMGTNNSLGKTSRDSSILTGGAEMSMFLYIWHIYLLKYGRLLVILFANCVIFEARRGWGDEGRESCANWR